MGYWRDIPKVTAVDAEYLARYFELNQWLVDDGLVQSPQDFLDELNEEYRDKLSDGIMKSSLMVQDAFKAAKADGWQTSRLSC